MNCPKNIKIGVITIIPEAFPGPLGYAVIGKGLLQKKWDLNVIDLKEYKVDKKIDDTPFGGGPGMIIRPDVLGNCLEDHKKHYQKIIYPCPRGKPISQSKIHQWQQYESILFICGRYEGIDDRILEYYPEIEIVCVGDIVMCGGEVPTMAIIESLVRPLCVSNIYSIVDESFHKDDNYIEPKNFTRPRIWNELSAPEVLFTGNHKKISQWKKDSSETNKDNRKKID